jgi:hypothetical protein
MDTKTARARGALNQLTRSPLGGDNAGRIDKQRTKMKKGKGQAAQKHGLS